MTLPPAPSVEVTIPAPAASGGRLSATSAIVGTALVALCVPLVGLLHVLPPSSRIDPMTRTISEYALGSNGWLFDVAVLALAIGSALVTASLIRAGAVTAVSSATVLLALWSVGLAVLVVFEKHNWQVGPSAGGQVHRVASLVAFVCLPTGALLMAGAARRRPDWRTPARWVSWTAIASVAALSPLFYAIALNVLTGMSWWRVFPLGAVERVLALAEVTTMLALGAWAIRAARVPTTPAS